MQSYLILLCILKWYSVCVFGFHVTQLILTYPSICIRSKSKDEIYSFSTLTYAQHATLQRNMGFAIIWNTFSSYLPMLSRLASISQINKTRMQKPQKASGVNVLNLHWHEWKKRPTCIAVPSGILVLVLSCWWQNVTSCCDSVWYSN